jgi:hypothetical protein
MTILGCNTLENDLKDKFGENSFNTYYLTTCRDSLIIENDLKTPVRV